MILLEAINWITCKSSIFGFLLLNFQINSLSNTWPALTKIEHFVEKSQILFSSEIMATKTEPKYNIPKIGKSFLSHICQLYIFLPPSGQKIHSYSFRYFCQCSSPFYGFFFFNYKWSESIPTPEFKSYNHIICPLIWKGRRLNPLTYLDLKRLNKL